MRFFRSVGARLSLALLVVVASALGIVYAVLVPILEQNLVDSKLDQLSASAGGLADRVPADSAQWNVFLQRNAPAVNARLSIVNVFPDARAPVVLVVADSQQAMVSQVTDPIAVRAFETGATEQGRVRSGGRWVAEAAHPIVPNGEVLVVRAPLGDTLANVDLVRRRLLLSGAFALVFSLAVGYGAAYLFARRLRRLERAADRIASGRFDEPIRDAGGDEVGELAVAFDRMRVRLERRRLDLGAVASALRDEFEAVARAARHPIETAVEGAPHGVGDEQRTLQIGRILVENALVHTPPGTPVRVRAAQRNGRAELVVEDEGPGIPLEQRERVFERFSRVEGGLASGSGLGLAIAKELAELMGGSIEVDSQPGATAFRLALPTAA